MISYCNGHYFYETSEVFMEVQAADIFVDNKGVFHLKGGEL